MTSQTAPFSLAFLDGVSQAISKQCYCCFAGGVCRAHWHSSWQRACDRATAMPNAGLQLSFVSACPCCKVRSHTCIQDSLPCVCSVLAHIRKCQGYMTSGAWPHHPCAVERNCASGSCQCDDVMMGFVAHCSLQCVLVLVLVSGT